MCQKRKTYALCKGKQFRQAQVENPAPRDILENLAALQLAGLH